MLYPSDTYSMWRYTSNPHRGCGGGVPPTTAAALDQHNVRSKIDAALTVISDVYVIQLKHCVVGGL